MKIAASSLCPRTVLIACNVKQMSKDAQPSFSAEDIAKIKKFSKTRSKVWASLGALRQGKTLFWVVFGPGHLLVRRKVMVFSLKYWS